MNLVLQACGMFGKRVRKIHMLQGLKFQILAKMILPRKLFFTVLGKLFLFGSAHF